MNNRPLVFLHFPKTGGTSLSSLFAQRSDSRHLVSSWREFDESEAESVDLIHGHVLFDQVQRLQQSSVFVTLLRHPIERAISYFDHIGRDPNHPDHHLGRDSFEAFVSSGAGSQQYLSQLTAEVVTGEENSRLCFSGSTRERVDIAKARLESFDLVGITEMMDASIDRLARILGWGDVPVVPVLNSGSAKLTRNDLAPNTIEELVHKGWADMELYEHAVSLFLKD